MKICFITSIHVSSVRGGVERVTDVLATGFRKKGHNVYLISLWGPKDNDTLADNQFVLPSSEANSLDNRNFMINFIHEYNIQIIINQSEVAPLLDMLSGFKNIIPIISVMHADPAIYLKSVVDNWDRWKYQSGSIKFYTFYLYWYLRKCYQLYTRGKYGKNKLKRRYELSTKVVLLSKRCIESYRKISGINDIDKIEVIPNPINFSEIVPPEKKEKIILFVGRLCFQKRLDRLINVWHRIKNHNGWKILVLGDGEDRAFYENMCKKINLQDIEFKGLTESYSYYQKASILCVTSTHEGFSLVLVEALAHEVIPISFNSFEPVYDIIKPEKTGFIIPSFSLSSYKSVLEKLIFNESLRETIRFNIRKDKLKDNPFQLQTVVNQWISLLNNIRK